MNLLLLTRLRLGWSARALALSAGLLLGAGMIGLTSVPQAAEPAAEPTSKYPDLPEGITSFGAAVADGYVYIYGGNTGKAHHYSSELQSNRFRRLDLNQPERWEDLPGEARLQGLAMVAHGGKIYRIGGFTAKNAEGEKADLWSVADVARFNPQTKTWEPLPSLPAPRSSHDAVVLGDKIYVAGGWAMSGNGSEAEWHRTALVLDLGQATLTWQELPEPPFRKRALSLATLEGKVYCIGGMLEEDGATTDVHYYDPKAKTWHAAPNLPGKSMEGFGNSSFEAGGRLYVSTVSGALLRLDGENWSQVAKLNQARFFHRMVTLSAHELLVLGGTARSEKALTVESIQLDSLAAK